MPTIRCCNTCEQTKPINEFRKTANPENYRHRCIICERAQNKEKNKIYYEKNKEVYLKKAKEKYKKRKAVIIQPE